MDEGLNIKLDTQYLIEEKEGHSLEHSGIRDNSLNRRISMTQALRSAIIKWDLTKLKSFCKAKDTVNRKYLQPTDEENVFTNTTVTEGKYPK